MVLGMGGKSLVKAAPAGTSESEERKTFREKSALKHGGL